MLGKISPVQHRAVLFSSFISNPFHIGSARLIPVTATKTSDDPQATFKGSPASPCRRFNLAPPFLSVLHRHEHRQYPFARHQSEPGGKLPSRLEWSYFTDRCASGRRR